MGLSLNNNVSSLTAQNNITRTNAGLNKSLERLSSGLKINRGADGPAALVISEQQRAQITGLRAAMDNTNKAIAVVQTTEGALNEMNGLLNKVRSLAIDSSNTGVNDANAQAANQAEISNILNTIDRISTTTQFGTKKLLEGSAGMSGVTTDNDINFLRATTDTVSGTYSVDIWTAAERAQVIAGTQQTTNLATNETLTINQHQISLQAGMTSSQVVDQINNAQEHTGVAARYDIFNGIELRSVRFGSAAKVEISSDVAAANDSSGFGIAHQVDHGVDIVGTFNGVAVTGVANVLTATSGAAKGLSVSADEAAALSTATVVGSQGDVHVFNNGITFQLGANAGQTIKLAIDKTDSTTLGMGASGLYSNLREISTANGTESLKVIDQAINEVSSQRAKLGSFQQNTLESNASTLRTSLENTTASESIVRDTDFASEIAEFTKQQTKMQAGSTVLGNANQLTQMVTGLLRG